MHYCIMSRCKRLFLPCFGRSAACPGFCPSCLLSCFLGRFQCPIVISAAGIGHGFTFSAWDPLRQKMPPLWAAVLLFCYKMYLVPVAIKKIKIAVLLHKFLFLLCKGLCIISVNVIYFHGVLSPFKIGIQHIIKYGCMVHIFAALLRLPFRILGGFCILSGL